MTVNHIKQIENYRKDKLAKNVKVITYITSDRPPPLSAQIAEDVIRIFYDHLVNIGEVDIIDLVLYSRGGKTIPPWRLVTLIREFCDEFNVIVPYRAHSAATLIALGANNIIMGPLGELSPIDPSIGTPFNPSQPDNPKQKIEIGVEDVTGYINLAKEKVGITNQENLVKVFEKLIDRIHPLAIGAVHRSHSLIRLLASKLLSLHIKETRESYSIPQIVDGLAEKLYYHNYLIGRDEAENLGLKIIRPEKKLEKMIWELYTNYEQEMGLGKPFNPVEYLGGQESEKTIEFPVASVESINLESRCIIKINVSKGIPGTQMPLPPPGKPSPIPININITKMGWKTEKRKEE